jgi:hypothetical protein
VITSGCVSPAGTSIFADRVVTWWRSDPTPPATSSKARKSLSAARGRQADLVLDGRAHHARDAGGHWRALTNSGDRSRTVREVGIVVIGRMNVRVAARI